ncbi:hypothetical protein JZ751_021027 [Albula glossodonta]|uniref:Uncharacterized protein n=1 Tax=Albula glossodonta TaxID=121402 RepID=A0A8T2PH10_9TELE|nr:hypothetical protein JZ751_021027 [Albula glossodonta]
MASSVSVSEEDLLCPVCHKIFSFPVTLKCGHNTCKVCVQTFWEWRGSRECPVCRRESSSDRPPIDLELKIAADELKQQKLERLTLSPDAQCGLHHEQLKLFCVIDQEPICIICQTSKKHRLHICCPVEEAALERKVQAEQTERQIKREFMKLHTFLRDEEVARVKALREEEEKKIQIVKEKIESITKKIALLSYTITPISLDPNTAHPNLTIGLELTGVKYNSKQKVPDNPERCISRLSVMAAQGFSSEKHSWEVDVGENKDWCIGVAKESAPRKKSIFLNPEEGFWVIALCNGDTFWAQTDPRTRLDIKKRPQKVKVEVNYNKGKVVFLNAVDMKKIYTFKHKFTGKLFPYFSPGVNGEGKSPCPIKICPLKVSITTE